MFIRYLIGLHFFFAIIFGVPLHFKRKTEGSEKIHSIRNIDPPTFLQNTGNYETLGGAFEGDMAFPYGFDPSKNSAAKGVALFGAHRWPNNVIPYDISAISSTSDQNTITLAMRTLMYAVGTPISGSTSRRSCVYFRPKTSSDTDYIRIVYGNGCSATPGYWSGYAMKLTLQQNGCFYSGTIQHELTHVLGFYHEQSRPDRDSYITVNYANIQSGYEFAFQKYSWGSTVLNQQTPYDYGSLMHYGAYDFSSNQQPTITPKQSGVTIGQRVQLSATDIAEIRSYYNC